MCKKFLILIFLTLNISLSAMDFNETIVIINEATEATQTLQEEFNTLVDDSILTTQIESIELDTGLVQVSEVISTIQIMETNKSIEFNSTSPIITERPFELNKSIEINSTIKVLELNSSTSSSCKENNQSILINGLSINLDENNTITDNGCTDSNLGTSAEGLIIFKTRIKPYCKITGDKFAKQYMQEDWDDIYHDKEFKMEVIKACPKVEKRYRDKWTPHLYQFSIEYASDSDAIPEC